MAAAAGLLVDARSLSKPSRFDGAEGRWRDWRFSFEADLGWRGHDILEMASQTAGSDRAVLPTAQLGADRQAVTKTLYFILVQTVGGRALQMLRAVPGRSGLVAWRQMVKHYEPKNPVRAAGLLQQILSPVFRQGSLAEWEVGWLA